METYMSMLFMIVATSIAALVVAGCGFLLLAMWTAVKERIDWL